ncbi:MAG: AI-2E family transporter [Maritimibacter sp.]|nr:AI-2E family transporter [Maritimibacter sp.]
MQQTPLFNLVLFLVLAVTLTTILYLGRGVILPIVAATILVYLMSAATAALARVPMLDRLPNGMLSFLVVLVFSLVVALFAAVVAATVRSIIEVIPGYEANLDRFIVGMADRLNLDATEMWDSLRTATIDRIDIEALTIALLGNFTSLGGMIFVILIYAAFLTGERMRFPAKIARALPEAGDAERVMSVVQQVNAQITTYLGVKTLINIILASICYVILWALGIDFALFWAIVIGMLNYIPYFGSYLGVAFPAVLSLAQFVSVPWTLLVTVLLTAAQFVVGNILEPRLIGRQLNLSPFVVLIALAFWGALWGIPGAMLAIPMTSILIIVLSQFRSTRFLAVLAAERLDPDPGLAARSRPAADEVSAP